MRIAFVIANAYGMGGTVRTVLTTAGGLAERHDVEIVSLARHREEPFFTVPDGVRIVPLSDSGARLEATGGPPPPTARDHKRAERSRAVIPQSERDRNKAFTPAAVTAFHRYLNTTSADAVVGTRPGINLLLSEWAPPRLVAVGQEHINLGEYKAPMRAAIARRYPRLDAMTVLTAADRAAYAELLGPRTAAGIEVLPNALPPGEVPHSTQDNPIIAAAGRMSPIKQYPKLFDAFARVVEEYPDWRLRVYGGGRGEDAVRRAVVEKGLSDHVMLMGRTKDLPTELAKASLLAVSSRVEGFGMTIIEGFAAGLPAVSFDAPHGPREIIADGGNGILVPHQDVGALGEALLRLVGDADERRRLSAGALASAGDYALDGVIPRWEKFLRSAGARRGRFGPARWKRVLPVRDRPAA